MTPTEIYRFAAEYGSSMVLSVGAFILCCWLVKHIAVSHTKALEGVTETLNKLINKIEQSERIQKEAHKYQRDEHVSMIGALEKINGKVS